MNKNFATFIWFNVLGLLFILSLALIALSPTINTWERANGYPYGRMCYSIFTGYVDTCK